MLDTAETTYPLNRTGLIVVDATNDFISEGGKRAVDVTAAYRPEMMHAAHELNGPTFAHTIVTTARHGDLPAGRRAEALVGPPDQDHAEVRGGLPGGAVRVGHVAAPTGEGHALAVEHDQQKLGHVPRNLARL